MFAAYADALAFQAGFRVAYANVSTASCGKDKDGVTVITLPLLPAEMSQDDVDKFLGLSAHEVEHENTTELGYMTKAKSVHDLVAELLNVYEDVRIEGDFGRRFMGGQLIINNMVSILVKEGFYSHPSKKTNSASLVTMFILHRLNADLLGQPVTEFADSHETAFEQTFSEDVQSKIRAVMAKAVSMQSTHDAYELAIETYNILLEAAKENSKKQPEPKTNGQGSSSQPSSSSNGQQQNIQPTQREGEEQHEKDEAAAEALNVESGDIENGDKSSQLDVKNLPKSSSPRIPARTINGSLFNGIARIGWINEAKMASNGLVDQLKAILENQNARGGKKRARSGKRMNSRALASAAAGDYSRGLYNKRAKGNAPHADVHLLVDCSDSMNTHNDIKVAMQAAMSIMMALENIPNTNVDVSGFTNNGNANHHRIMGNTTEEKMKVMSSINALHMMGTPTNEGILGAINCMNLDIQSDKRILFVIQDGDGYIQSSTFELAEKHGIHVVGIGIGCDVSDKYKNHININSVHDLSNNMFSLLRSELVA